MGKKSISHKFVQFIWENRASKIQIPPFSHFHCQCDGGDGGDGGQTYALFIKCEVEFVCHSNMNALRQICQIISPKWQVDIYLISLYVRNGRSGDGDNCRKWVEKRLKLIQFIYLCIQWTDGRTQSGNHNRIEMCKIFSVIRNACECGLEIEYILITSHRIVHSCIVYNVMGIGHG